MQVVSPRPVIIYTYFNQRVCGVRFNFSERFILLLLLIIIISFARKNISNISFMLKFTS
jgi:hypothetical protein